MNLNSLRTKITLIFLITFLMILALIPMYIEYEKKMLYQQTETRYKQISTYINTHHLEEEMVVTYVESLSFKYLVSPQLILEQVDLAMDGRDFHMFTYKKNYYFYINTPVFRILFKDLGEYQTNNMVYLLFSFVLLILLLIYAWLIKSLQPLYDLKNDIAKFAEGDLSISCASNKKDEIAEVANEFDRAVKKIDLLLHSRQLFLRTVMHELKTPIAKGRIVSELLDEKRQRDRLIFIFEKLDFLINDFAKVEEIVSHNYDLHLEFQLVEDLIHNAIEMLMLDKPYDKISLDLLLEKRVKVDFYLLSMVIKNLIDNGLKYSTDKKVHLKENKNSLDVYSNGRRLKRPLNDYFEPFHNEVDICKQGMGLGLYIIKSVLDIHEMRLEYKHEEGVNVFSICFNRV